MALVASRQAAHARRAGLVAVAASLFLFPATAAAETIVIKVVSVTTSGKANDTKPKGPSRGDRIVLTSSLFNPAAQFGKPRAANVGSDRATLTFSSHTKVLIEGVAKLPGGTIHFRGPGTFGKTRSIPVVSGTGRYSGAHGTLTIGAGDAPLNTYRLTLPVVA